MNDADDQERRLAEALRAQAARAPLPAEQTTRIERPAEGPQDLSLTGGGYGLLSGSDVGLPLPVRSGYPPAGAGEHVADVTERIDSGDRTAAGWILLLAVLLGLAAGAVVGLLTLI